MRQTIFAMTVHQIIKKDPASAADPSTGRDTRREKNNVNNPKTTKSTKGFYARC